MTETEPAGVSKAQTEHFFPSWLKTEDIEFPEGTSLTATYPSTTQTSHECHSPPVPSEDGL